MSTLRRAAALARRLVGRRGILLLAACGVVAAGLALTLLRGADPDGGAPAAAPADGGRGGPPHVDPGKAATGYLANAFAAVSRITFSPPTWRGRARGLGPIRTLVRSSHDIDAFAQDGRDLAWMTADGRCGDRLQIRRASDGRSVAIDGVDCTDNPSQSALIDGERTLAGGRALWNVAYGFSNEREEYLLRTAAVSDRRVRTLPCCSMEGRLSGVGARLPLAGSGSLLVYYAHPEAAVKRVFGARTKKLFDIERALDLAVDGDRVATVQRKLVHGDGCGCNYSPVWSPDGTKVLFSRKPDRRPPWSSGGADFALINADGSGLRMLTTDHRDRESLDWSNDGTKLVYTYWNDSLQRRMIAVSDADGSEPRDVVAGDKPEWSPSGTAIVFEALTASGGEVAVYVVNADGTGLRRLSFTMRAARSRSPAVSLRLRVRCRPDEAGDSPAVASGHPQRTGDASTERRSSPS
jgi:hypothetical protein